jgi:hypothetical protein
MRLGLTILVKFDGGPLGCDILVASLFYTYNCEQDRQATYNITANRTGRLPIT